MGERGLAAGPTLVQRLFYATCKVIVYIIFRTALRVRVTGRGRVPRSGGVLLVANHQSYLDPPLIGVWLRRRFHSMAREGLFEPRALRWIIRALGAFPVREGGRPDLEAVRRAVTLLESGEIVLIFPEGTRTAYGSVGEFKPGVALLLKRASCPVVPVAIGGAFEAWPRRRRTPKLFRRLRVAFGEPIDSGELLADGAEAAVHRLREEVVRLGADLRPAGAAENRRGQT